MKTISERLVAAALATPNLDAAADALAGAVNEAYAAGGERGRQLKDLLNGTWLGHPLHPALTDVPVGAWTAALALDLLCERRGAKIAIGVGLLGAVGAALSGLSDWVDTFGRRRQLGVAHATINGTATLLYATSFFMRGRADGPAIGLSALGYGLVALGALYGGVMSLDWQVGVNHAHAEDPPADELDVAALSEIPDGGMKRVEPNGYPVLLVRRGNDVYALGALCAHAGGPLDEGALDGEILRCPWHGSEFCVRDGSVVRGPAAFPPPAFKVRISGDRVRLAGPATPSGP
ncbi:MAG TPA: Rieske 2Fe-2S domain-containing protein [Candidatus Elarobacter sp.]|nr:Rieske 2Fe-2S domain-containing protein [Candidatus Elarobacter sp.]